MNNLDLIEEGLPKPQGDPDDWCGCGECEAKKPALAALLAVRGEMAAMREALSHYEWRSISEIHEDYGPCVLMHIEDPGRLEIGSNLDPDFFEEPEWTHFAEVPKLASETAKALKSAMAGVPHVGVEVAAEGRTA